MLSKYFYTLRPGDYGCQPAGFVNKKSVYTPVKIEIASIPGHEPILWHCSGFVEYEKPLTFEQIWKYDLSPADKVEWAHYRFWNFANRNYEDAAYFERDYVGAMRLGNCPGMPETISLATEILFIDGGQMKPCPYCDQPAEQLKREDRYRCGNRNCTMHYVMGVCFREWENRPQEDKLQKEIEMQGKIIFELRQRVVGYEDALAQEKRLKEILRLAFSYNPRAVAMARDKVDGKETNMEEFDEI
jgi:hypothetical protein